VEGVKYVLLPVSASFKVLSLPQKFNRFHIPALMFYKKGFRFQLLKKSTAFEFASSFLLQSASASTKI